MTARVNRASADEILTFADRARSEWEIPGIAVGAVVDGETVVADGLGVRRFGEAGQVDADTVFPVASVSKTFTGTLAGYLVESGAVRLDTKVSGLLDEFVLPDPWVTANVNLADLLSHRIGWNDWFWANFASRRDFDRRGIVSRFRHEGPITGFRQTLTYSDLLFTAGGEALSAAGGASWEDLVEEVLLQPLGMTATGSTTRHAAQASNLASGHFYAPGVTPDTINTDAWWHMDNFGPAGGVSSTVNDLLTWLRLHVGNLEGSPISPTAVRTAHTPQMVADGLSMFNDDRITGYGLGWQTGYHGPAKLVCHTGTFRGYSAWLGVVPELGVGAVVLANARWASKGGFSTALGRWMVDAIAGLPRTDTLSEKWRSWSASQAPRPQITDSPGSTPPIVAGDFASPSLGAWSVEIVGPEQATVSRTGGGSHYRATLKPVGSGLWSAAWNDPLEDYWPAHYIRFEVGLAPNRPVMAFVSGSGVPDRRFVLSD